MYCISVKQKGLFAENPETFLTRDRVEKPLALRNRLPSSGIWHNISITLPPTIYHKMFVLSVLRIIINFKYLCVVLILLKMNSNADSLTVGLKMSGSVETTLL